MAAVATHNHCGPVRRRYDSPVCVSTPSQSPRLPPSTTNHQLPPQRDSRKAQKLLGLIVDLPPPTSRRNTMNLEIARPSSSSGILKAQRTLGMVVDGVPGGRDRRRSCMGGDVGGVPFNGSLEEKLAQAEKEIRRMSGMGALVDLDVDMETKMSEGTWRRQSASPREWVDLALDVEDEGEREEELVPKRLSVSPTPPRIELSNLPSPYFSPEPIELDAVSTQRVCRAATRSRQSSCASSRFHDRPTNKIASSRSRGLRANTCPPNFSRPLEATALKSIPGEDMERDPLSVRYEKEPPTPISPITESPFAFDNVKEAKANVEEELRLAMGNGSIKPRLSFQQQQRQLEDPRPKKARWTSLPVSLIKLTKRHVQSKHDESGILIPDHGQVKKGKAHLTTENLQRWEDEVGYVPKMYKIGLGLEVTRSPVEMDIEIQQTASHQEDHHSSISKRTLPFRTAPSRAQTPIGSPTPQHHNPFPVTPPASPPLIDTTFSRPRPPYLSSLVSISFTKRPLLSPLLTPPPSHPSPPPSQSHSHSRTTSHSTTHSLPISTSTTTTTTTTTKTSTAASTSSPRPLHTQSHPPSLATQKEIAATTQLSTCVMCREAEHPSTFPTRKITARCAHPTRVCLECLRVWIARGAEAAEGGGGGGRARCVCPECGVGLSEEDVRAFVRGLGV